MEEIFAPKKIEKKQPAPPVKTGPGVAKKKGKKGKKGDDDDNDKNFEDVV
jgi:hypothetical protein